MGVKNKADRLVSLILYLSVMLLAATAASVCLEECVYSDS